MGQRDALGGLASMDDCAGRPHCPHHPFNHTGSGGTTASPRSHRPSIPLEGALGRGARGPHQSSGSSRKAPVLQGHCALWSIHLLHHSQVKALCPETRDLPRDLCLSSARPGLLTHQRGCIRASCPEPLNCAQKDVFHSANGRDGFLLTPS